MDGAQTGRVHMARDEQLAREQIPTVRFFEWRPAAVSLGWKQPAPAWLQGPDAVPGVRWVERPTGGGIALHGTDLSISVIVPRRLELPLGMVMRTVCESAVNACRSFGAQAEPLLEGPGAGRIAYCLAEESPYAVMAQGLKLAGLAARRYPDSWLVQGSLLVRPIDAEVAGWLPPAVRARLTERAAALADVSGGAVTEAAVAARWARDWGAWWEASLLDTLGAVA